jgi:Flp pilus assembly protein TadG
MDSKPHNRKGERGATLLEFVFVATGFFTMLIAICAGSNLYFTHNALVEATRRGARYAATQPSAVVCGTPTTGSSTCAACLTRIQNYAIYGNSAGTGTPMVNGLQTTNINVEYSNFGVGQGSVSVNITGYTYYFVIPFINQAITMPAYRTTLAGENAGVLPDGTCVTN